MSPKIRYAPRSSVCADAPGVDELALSVDELIAQRLHLHVGDRIAELVGDAAGNGAAARQAEIDLVEHLAGGDVERLARLERSRLSVLERDEPGLVDEQAIASGRKRGQLVTPLAVGRVAVRMVGGTADSGDTNFGFSG